jgi:hypothetical protein
VRLIGSAEFGGASEPSGHVARCLYARVRVRARGVGGPCVGARRRGAGLASPLYQTLHAPKVVALCVCFTNVYRRARYANLLPSSARLVRGTQCVIDTQERLAGCWDALDVGCG